MFGIKVGKTLRKNNASVWPENYHRLDVLLQPVTDELQGLWWATAPAQYDLPTEWILEGSDEKRDDWQPLSGPSYALFEEMFVPGADPPVARPGFLPTFAYVVSGDWTVLYGFQDNPADDKALLSQLSTIGWFAPPSEFPPSVSVVVRGIDWAYWEFFFRKPEPIDLIEQHLKQVRGLYLRPLPTT